MKQNGTNKWLENLPAHTPPDGMWERIETRMDNDLRDERLRAQLAGLPEHEPPYVLWSRIEQSLAHRRFVRIGVIAAGIAATLLLAFMLNGLLLPDFLKHQPGGMQTSKLQAFRSPQVHVNAGIPKQTGKSTGRGRTKLNAGVAMDNPNYSQVDHEREQKTAPQAFPLLLPADRNFRESAVVSQITDSLSNESFPGDSGMKALAMAPLIMKPAQMNQRAPAGLPGSETLVASHPPASKPDTLTAWLLLRKSKDELPPPPPVSTSRPSNGVSIGFNYLPEPAMRSGNRSSSYQTFALMAQYQMPSVDVRTSLGISYQASPMEYQADYVSLNNNYSAVIDRGSVDISGKERSSFLYYTLGAGKRIYSGKRVSTTLHVGAGISVLLNNQHNISGPVYDLLINQANTYFTNTQSNIPDINQTHFDLVSGFEFNYRLHKKWSLSIEPTMKYYFKPVFNGTDSRSFSTGLRTGVLFKL